MTRTAATLDTARMVLRPLTAGDADTLVTLHGDPEVMRYLDRPRSAAQVHQTDLPAMLAHAGMPFGYWIATERTGDTVLGWFGFRPPNPPLAPPRAGDVELGYRLHQAAWGRGYATEGARALVEHGFTALGVTRVVAGTMAVNRGSRAVLEKVGLRHVRTHHEDWPDPLPGAEDGEVEYALTLEQWRSGRTPPATGPAPSPATPR